jgi:hypothetical protein
MNMYLHRSLTFAICVCSAAILATVANADPLPGEVAKFDQKPMIATAVTGQIYFGHDELSTAYGDISQPIVSYTGRFMADDFADKVNTPVVHLTWWGSYINDNIAAAPQPHVKNFLIAFESDVPANTATGVPSHPGCVPAGCNPVLQSDVVSLGALAPSSGTFTETLERNADPVINEVLYKYNAELHLGHEFFEKADNVYWLKITALVDTLGPLPQPVPPGTTQWGWHNRDYTLKDTLASTSPAVNPGEFQDGTVPGTTLPIWHFQDDAVQGDVQFTPSLPPGQNIRQLNMSPANYVFVNSAGIGPIDGPPGIEQHSKDLAFRLYTSVPEPASCLLICCGSLGLALFRRGRAG